MTMSTVKKILTALAATIAMVAAAQMAGTIHIPPMVMSALNQGAIWIGILGASPIGRIVFQDAPSNDIVPPDERLPAGKPLTS